MSPAIHIDTRGRCARSPLLRSQILGSLAVGLLVACPLTVHAWGRLGHEVAGHVTQRYLSDAAQAQVEALLGDEPLAEASHWADRMRADPAPFWQDEAGPYHYVTVPPGDSYDASAAPPQGDAVTALAMFQRELRAPGTPRSRKQLALRFALHIVQDLHQPLHVGNGRDRGGNDVLVTVNGEPSNLHRLWDAQILDAAGRGRREWLGYLDTSGLLRAPRAGDDEPRVWISESAELRNRLYPAVRLVSDDYFRDHLPAAEQRLALSGIRAAAWINTTFEMAATAAPAAQEAPRSWWRRLLDL